MKIRLFTIPNMITLCNLLAGCAAVISVLGRHDLSWAFAFVAMAAVFDFLDGFVARLTKSYSAIGKELDSLADMVSFGVAPAAVLGAAIGKIQYRRKSDQTVYRVADTCLCPLFRIERISGPKIRYLVAALEYSRRGVDLLRAAHL